LRGTGVAIQGPFDDPHRAREEVTWLTTSVTAETNSRAATRIATASDRETADPAAAAWSLRAAAPTDPGRKRTRSRNRLGFDARPAASDAAGRARF
jgi:hypothetical protein